MHQGLVATPSPARAANRGIGPESCRPCWGRLGNPVTTPYKIGMQNDQSRYAKPSCYFCPRGRGGVV